MAQGTTFSTSAPPSPAPWRRGQAGWGGRFVGSLQGMTNAKCKPRPKDHGVVTRLGGARWRGGHGHQF